MESPAGNRIDAKDAVVFSCGITVNIAVQFIVCSSIHPIPKLLAGLEVWCVFPRHGN